LNQNRTVKHKLTILCLLLVLGLVVTSQPKTTINQASNVEFADLMMKHSNELIIDVRDTTSYDNQFISGAILVPTQAELIQLLDTLDLDTPMLVYCSFGIRSYKACEVMINKGFKTVVNLEKGIEFWEKKQFPIVTNP